MFYMTIFPHDTRIILSKTFLRFKLVWSIKSVVKPAFLQFGRRRLSTHLKTCGKSYVPIFRWLYINFMHFQIHKNGMIKKREEFLIHHCWYKTSGTNHQNIIGYLCSFRFKTMTLNAHFFVFIILFVGGYADAQKCLPLFLSVTAEFHQQSITAQYEN